MSKLFRLFTGLVCLITANLSAQDLPAVGEAARLIKRETRDFFKTGPATADIYAETVDIDPVVEWGGPFRPVIDGEYPLIDFQLPVKVESFLVDGDAWELALVVFPAFDSDTSRIPGPPPELYGEPYQALITMPRQRAVRVHGEGKAKELAAVFIPQTVWSAAIFNGKVQSLRLGWSDMPPKVETSKLSPPHFSLGDPMTFRFAANRLLADDTIVTFTPDQVLGLDFTDYARLADYGGPYGNTEADSVELYIQSLWIIEVTCNLMVSAIAPLIEGRGAGEIIKLESLDLGPSYEDELKALKKFADRPNPHLSLPLPPGWKDILQGKLGNIPASQRGPESSPF